MGRLRHVVLVLALAGPAPGAAGATLESAGYSFSDDEGGFRLLAVSGSGSEADPFVIVEEIAGPGPAVLTVRRPAGAVTRDARGVIALGISMRKVVRNASAIPWSRFTFELREQLHLPSDYYDGLSFDQLGSGRRAARADRYATAQSVHEPRDVIRFADGLVGPGARVTFDVLITDTSPQRTFYLVQMPDVPVAAAGAARRKPRPLAPGAAKNAK